MKSVFLTNIKKGPTNDMDLINYNIATKN